MTSGNGWPGHARVLVLNASYEAIHVCDLRRAVRMVLSGTASTVEEGDRYLHSPSTRIRVPEVIRLQRFVHIPFKDVTFCRKNIMLRDNHRCQYCGRSGHADELTLDHIIPLSRGGMDSWDNVVTACKKCNSRKGNQLPHEIDMWPLNRPIVPSSITFLHLVRHLGQDHQRWRKYLFLEAPDTQNEIRT